VNEPQRVLGRVRDFQALPGTVLPALTGIFMVPAGLLLRGTAVTGRTAASIRTLIGLWLCPQATEVQMTLPTARSPA